MATYNASHNYLISASMAPAVYWTSLSGGEFSNDTSSVFTGGFGPPTIVPGPSQTGQITLEKPYDPTEDTAIIAWNAAYHEGIQIPVTVTVIPRTAAGGPRLDEPPLYFLQCYRVSMSLVEPRKGTAEPTMLRLVLHPTTRA